MVPGLRQLQRRLAHLRSEEARSAQPGQSSQGCPAPVFALCQAAQATQGASPTSGQLQCTGSGPTPGAPGSFKPFTTPPEAPRRGRTRPARHVVLRDLPAGLSGLTPGG